MTLLRRCLPLSFLFALLSQTLFAGPLTFEFVPPPAAAIKNPFARELWAEVVTPSGRTLLLPAFYVGEQRFAVRARPDEIGTYRLGTVLEGSRGERPHAVEATPHSPATLENKQRLRLPPVGISARHSDSFARADGRAFVPFGANLAWAHGDVLPYYRNAFAQFRAANLNWMRLWMVHWGGTNLDWIDAPAGPSPAPGGLDLNVAQRWDDLLAAAEENGVYLQVVLQHHGQYSTAVNPSWAENPWNAANPGGFLKSASDFFTDPNARLITALKYRYIVARWGWSPAVFAWELFNEVHWVDTWKIDHNEAAVARWHDEMATLIRAVDTYAHPITTSTENLQSAIYAQMDFLQPHLYAADLVAAVRTFAPRVEGEKRPIFYGEFGVDHVPAPEEVRRSGIADIPPAWAALMGEGRLPAQPWEGGRLIEQGRLGELGAVPRFVVGSGFARHPDLVPFSALVESDTRVPLRLAGCQAWQRRPARTFTLPLDSREPLELGDWPAIFVVPASAERDAFPSRATFRAEFPQDTTLRLQIAEMGRPGSGFRVRVDGAVAADATWADGMSLPAVLTVPVKAGRREITFENNGAADWVRVPSTDFGFTVPALAAFGRRNDRFIALWVRHREQLLELLPGKPAAGVLVIDDVPAGDWYVTWWDTTTGTPGATTQLAHRGGPARIPTPPILRHAALVLVRSEKKPEGPKS